jgi:hypothetical protein
MPLFIMYFISDSIKKARRQQSASLHSHRTCLAPIAQCLTLTSRLASRRTFSPVLKDSHPGTRGFRRWLSQGCRRWFSGFRSIVSDRLFHLLCDWHLFLLFKA